MSFGNVPAPPSSHTPTSCCLDLAARHHVVSAPRVRRQNANGEDPCVSGSWVDVSKCHRWQGPASGDGIGVSKCPKLSADACAEGMVSKRQWQGPVRARRLETPQMARTTGARRWGWCLETLTPCRLGASRGAAIFRESMFVSRLGYLSPFLSTRPVRGSSSPQPGLLPERPAALSSSLPLPLVEGLHGRPLSSRPGRKSTFLLGRPAAFCRRPVR